MRTFLICMLSILSISLAKVDVDKLTIGIKTNKYDKTKIDVTFTTDGDEITYIVDEPKDDDELAKLTKTLAKKYRERNGKL